MKKRYKTIFVAGHNGLVGSSIYRCLQKIKNVKLITIDKKKINLEDQTKTKIFLKKNKPDYVILAAALAGGIWANEKYCADFIEKNIIIQHNIITSCHQLKIKRLLFLGSSCIYPKFSKQPMKENYLLKGELESTNEAYAVAKIAGLKMCTYFNKQYKTDFRVVMPTNIYGINDRYDSMKSHVIPALIEKIHLAKKKNRKNVQLWGTGKARREFMFVDDLAKICVDILFLSKKKYYDFLNKKKIEFINVGCQKDIDIKSLAQKICKVIFFRGKIMFNKKMKDGTPRKLLDVSNLRKLLNYKYSLTRLDDGLKITYKSYLKKIA